VAGYSSARSEALRRRASSRIPGIGCPGRSRSLPALRVADAGASGAPQDRTRGSIRFRGGLQSRWHPGARPSVVDCPGAGVPSRDSGEHARRTSPRIARGLVEPRQGSAGFLRHPLPPIRPRWTDRRPPVRAASGAEWTVWDPPGTDAAADRPDTTGSSGRGPRPARIRGHRRHRPATARPEPRMVCISVRSALASGPCGRPSWVGSGGCDGAAVRTVAEAAPGPMARPTRNAGGSPPRGYLG
jgi:hypothetical protein